MVRSSSLGAPCVTVGHLPVSVLNDLSPEQYLQVQDELCEQARQAGADAIVTHHHLCHREGASSAATVSRSCSTRR
jgi:hypothetical protein